MLSGGLTAMNDLDRIWVTVVVVGIGSVIINAIVLWRATRQDRAFTKRKQRIEQEHDEVRNKLIAGIALDNKRKSNEG